MLSIPVFTEAAHAGESGRRSQAGHEAFLPEEGRQQRRVQGDSAESRPEGRLQPSCHWSGGVVMLMPPFFQQVCHSKSGEINPVKVGNLVKAYVDKYKHARKRQKEAVLGEQTEPIRAPDSP